MSRGLVLTHTGRYTMVHKAACHMAQRGNADPWTWADMVGAAEVNQAIAINYHRTCKRCMPSGGINA